MLLALRHRWSDGTTHLRLQPLELLERLAAVTPRPRINLVLYYGLLAAHAAWRSRLPAPGDSVRTAGLSASQGRDKAAGAAAVPAATGGVEVSPRMAMTASVRPGSNWLRARLMQRSFGVDVLACPRCGDRFELIALIEDPLVSRRILNHLALPTGVPAPCPARPPPLPLGRPAAWGDDLTIP